MVTNATLRMVSEDFTTRGVVQNHLSSSPRTGLDHADIDELGRCDGLVPVAIGDWAYNRPLTGEEHRRLRGVLLSLAIGATAGSLTTHHYENPDRQLPRGRHVAESIIEQIADATIYADLTSTNTPGVIRPALGRCL
jgi:hypothetical protein